MTRTRKTASFVKALRNYLLPALLVAGATASSVAQAQVPTLNVTKPNGTPVTGYRWLIEEDRMHHIQPGQTCLNGNVDECLSVDFHRSHMPVIAEGYAGDPLPDLDGTKHYYVSVLPYSAGTGDGSGLSAAPIAPGQASVNVVVNDLPTPTAQIRVFVFEDNYPINNVPDLPEESGVEGFGILLFDAAGRFGVAGGQILQDAYGNPLGTSYNPDGTVNVLGDGTLQSGPDGYVTIQNLVPGKYGVQVVPPAGAGWQQTSTIEGTKTIDAWVKANEPAYFAEFGPPGPHVFVGFVKNSQVAPWTNAETGEPLLSGTGGAAVRGRIMNIHGSRPPEFAFYTGTPLGGCWVGLNDLSVGEGKGLYAAPCDGDSHFTIPNVPPGNYQLAIWDGALDAIFGSYNFTVADGESDVNLLDVPVFNWFAKLDNYVFYDSDADGYWDEGEPPIPEQNINIRWRDGTIYAAMPTDLEGASPFEEVFPFFSWLVAEVDFARFKATGATVVVDAGGPIDPTDPWTFDGSLNPQPQSENGGAPFRTETGPVLTQAFQGFLGQKSAIMWGKQAYDLGENGGISGIVFYATTRAEDDPRFAVAEEWEPGIPRIQVELYADAGGGVIADRDGDGVPTQADVDNYPFDNFPGAEDFDRDGDGIFDYGDALQITYTDSWDDSLPTNCQGDVYLVDGVTPTDCFDGLRNFNQVRPGVFDGGYAFDSYYADGMANVVDLDTTEPEALPAGNYIVATGRHPVYKVVKEEDKNVDFGDTYVAPQLLPPVCVGDLHEVPQYLSFRTDEDGVPLPGAGEQIEAPFAGDQIPDSGDERPLCDRKQVRLADGQNAAADFFLHTTTPIAGHVVGFILDDLSNEFDPNAPTFGEKYSPPFLPVSIRDWTGREIVKTYSDRWGRYNALIPSTYTMNVPMPSGASPNMLVACMNSANDPNYNPQYSQFCYTFQYMPGTTTYLDTPVVPVAAFPGPGQFPLDCEFPTGTPVIASVSGDFYAGPYVRLAQDGAGWSTGSLTIESAGLVPVLNPDFGAPGEPKTILRDFGFGANQGSVSIGGVSVPVTSWTDSTITVSIASNVPSGQLVVTRSDGAQSRTGVTVTVDLESLTTRNVHEVFPGPGTPIQNAIDAASDGDLILLAPGTYEEMVILWKPVQLQGSGANTIINAVNAPGEKLQAWRNKVEQLVTLGAIDLLPAQEIGFGLPEPATLMTEEGSGILVLAQNGAFTASPNARIDGVSITGSDNGGGIVVNGYASHLEISNNRIYGNYGIYGGGIRVGHPALVVEDAEGGLSHQDGYNEDVRIHHNWVSRNGANGGVGGGIGLLHGADRYQVTDNFICGNFTQGDGGGVGHLGLNRNGLIARNQIVFNHSFSQGTAVSGGGLYISGAPSLAGPGGLSEGSGSVRVEANLIQGNLAGAGDGGAVRLVRTNGTDVVASRSVYRWHRIDLVDNIIANNVAGYAGGGISLQDAAYVNVLHNTIANNDSTATAGQAFQPGSPNTSTPQPAGVVSYAHSPELAAAIATWGGTRDQYAPYSNPTLANNLIWHNRSFHFAIDPGAFPPQFGLVPDVGAGAEPSYWDLAVMPAGTGVLTVEDCGAPTPNFVNEYVNGERSQTIQQLELTTSISAVPAFDEGGNFIDVHFGPLTLGDSDYHLLDGPNACASIATTYPQVADDFDGDARPSTAVDAGADETLVVTPPPRPRR